MDGVIGHAADCHLRDRRAGRTREGRSSAPGIELADARPPTSARREAQNAPFEPVGPCPPARGTDGRCHGRRVSVVRRDHGEPRALASRSGRCECSRLDRPGSGGHPDRGCRCMGPAVAGQGEYQACAEIDQALLQLACDLLGEDRLQVVSLGRGAVVLHGVRNPSAGISRLPTRSLRRNSARGGGSRPARGGAGASLVAQDLLALLGPRQR